MTEREFQNMFIFSPGFEAATLKIPTTNSSDSDENGNNTSNTRKQIIGFAKFRSRMEAMEAKDVLTGRKIDPEKGCVLKAEMAKKNLHTKRGPSSNNSSHHLNALNSIERVASPTGLPFNHLNILKPRFDPFNTNPCSPLPQEILSPTEFPYDTFADLESRPPFSSKKPNSRAPGFGMNLKLSDRSLPQMDSFLGGSLFSSGVDMNSFSKRLNGLSINTSMASSVNNTPSLLSPTYTPTPLPLNSTASVLRTANSNDQNPPCNTLYVGNLPMSTSEDELHKLFSSCIGFKRLCFRTKANSSPMCFVEFDDILCATQALNDLDGHPLSNSNNGGIRLSFSKNPLGVRQALPAKLSHSTMSKNPSMTSLFMHHHPTQGSLPVPGSVDTPVQM